jgi:hypothetical protein
LVGTSDTEVVVIDLRSKAKQPTYTARMDWEIAHALFVSKSAVVFVSTHFRPKVERLALTAMQRASKTVDFVPESEGTLLEENRVHVEEGRQISIPKDPLLLDKASVSVSAALVQALSSNDSVLLDTVLNSASTNTKGDYKMILATIQNVPRSLVPRLLSALSDRMTNSYARLRQLVPWLRAVLESNVNLVSSNDECAVAMRQLLVALEKRMRVRDRMVRLVGRLELVLSQVASVEDDTDGQVLEIDVSGDSRKWKEKFPSRRDAVDMVDDEVSDQDSSMTDSNSSEEDADSEQLNDAEDSEEGTSDEDEDT